MLRDRQRGARTGLVLDVTGIENRMTLMKNNWGKARDYTACTESMRTLSELSLWV